MVLHLISYSQYKKRHFCKDIFIVKDKNIGLQENNL